MFEFMIGGTDYRAENAGINANNPSHTFKIFRKSGDAYIYEMTVQARKNSVKAIQKAIDEAHDYEEFCEREKSAENLY